MPYLRIQQMRLSARNSLTICYQKMFTSELSTVKIRVGAISPAGVLSHINKYITVRGTNSK